MVKNLPANAEDMGSIPGSGRSHGGGNGNPLQYSCLENPMDRGAWQATVHGVAKSQTQLRDYKTTKHQIDRYISYLMDVFHAIYTYMYHFISNRGTQILSMNNDANPTYIPDPQSFLSPKNPSKEGASEPQSHS